MCDCNSTNINHNGGDVYGVYAYGGYSDDLLTKSNAGKMMIAMAVILTLIVIPAISWIIGEYNVSDWQSILHIVSMVSAAIGTFLYLW